MALFGAPSRSRGRAAPGRFCVREMFSHMDLAKWEAHG